MGTRNYQDDYESQGGPGGPDGGGVQLNIAVPQVTPWVKRLMLMNAACFLIQWIFTLAGQESLLSSAMYLNPGVWKDLAPFFPLWQVLTYGFLHGGAGHLLMNLLMLFFFGTMLEGILGANRFVVLYLAGMVIGAVLFLLAAFFQADMTPALGASGGVLTVVVAAATLRPNRQVLFLFIPVKLKWLAMGVVAIDFYSAVNSMAGVGGSGTAHLIHLGGAIYGFLAVRFGWINHDPIRLFEVKRAVRAEVRRAGDEQRMDSLLQKIHKEGINSLSRSDREFLKRSSDRRPGD